MTASGITLDDLQDAIFRDQVMQARRMDEQGRFRAGLEQGDFATGLMLSGIKAEFPDVDAETARKLLRQRLQILRRLEEHGFYRPAEAA